MRILTNQQGAWWCNALQLPGERMLWNPSTLALLASFNASCLVLCIAHWGHQLGLCAYGWCQWVFGQLENKIYEKIIHWKSLLASSLCFQALNFTQVSLQLSKPVLILTTPTYQQAFNSHVLDQWLHVQTNKASEWEIQLLLKFLTISSAFTPGFQQTTHRQVHYWRT